MDALPVVRVAAADARQIGAGPLGAPQERMVVDRLARGRVRAVALDLGLQRAHLLRVAADAALADIDVAPHQPQRRVRDDARIGLGGRMLEEQRQDLHEAGNADHHDGAQDQPADVLLQRLVRKEASLLGHDGIRMTFRLRGRSRPRRPRHWHSPESPHRRRGGRRWCAPRSTPSPACRRGSTGRPADGSGRTASWP